jgi:arginine-tRNA-protein transferase
MRSSEIPLFLENPHDCPYVEGEQCSNIICEIPEAGSEMMDMLFAGGWRHFGDTFFRPQCPKCQKCKGIRIKVREFRPNRSQQRNLKANSELKAVVSDVIVNSTRLNLVNKFQDWRSVSRNWKEQNYSENQYRDSFFWQKKTSRELAIYNQKNELIAVSLFDEATRHLNAIYTYYNPEMRKFGLGNFAILQLIEHARLHNKEWVYLGLWNPECISLSYKGRFSGAEIFNYDTGEWGES